MKLDNQIGRFLHYWNSDSPTPAEKFAFGKPAALNLLSGSYRGSKSVAICKIAAVSALLFPGAMCGVYREFKAELTTTTFLTLLGLIDPRVVSDLDNTKLALTLVNGSQFFCHGAKDHIKLGSNAFSMSIVDEATKITEEAFGQISGRNSHELSLPPNYSELNPIYRQLADWLVDCRPTYLAANPEGREHWLFEKFIDEVTRDPDSRHITTNSLNNHHLSINYTVDNLLTTYLKSPRSHSRQQRLDWVMAAREGKLDLNELAQYLTIEGQRKVLGMWVTSGSSIFEIDPRHQEISADDIPEMVADSYRIIGIDFGFQNPRIIVIQCDPSKFGWKYTCLDYKAPVRPTGDEFAGLVAESAAEWGVDLIYHPHDQPQTALDIADKTDATLVKAIVAVSSGISTAQSALSTNRVKYIPKKTDDYATFKREMLGYAWQLDPATGKPLDVPLKVNDHFCFIAGTMVDTPSGPVPIETLKVGDLVTTPIGPRELTFTHHRPQFTYDFTFSDGIVTGATGDHPYFARDGKQYPILELLVNSNLELWNASLILASQHIGDNQILTPLKGLACNVQTLSKSTNTAKLGSALVPAVRVISGHPVGIREVYTLTVDDAHCFYANGHLVSNCDAFRYAVHTFNAHHPLPYVEEEAAEEEYPGGTHNPFAHLTGHVADSFSSRRDALHRSVRR